MIEFVTLFLALIVGPRPLEVSVGPQVTSVQVVLDGKAVTTLTGEPWRTDIDFGPRLVPHELVAIARDSEDRELGRVVQWVNMLRPTAEARFTLEHGEAGGPTSARLIWKALEHDAPQQVSITFDGMPLEVQDPRRFELPPHGTDSLHFLRAELYFSEAVQAQAELVFGGTYGDSVSTELTAVPIDLGKRRRLPKLKALAGLFTSRGEPVRAVAIERPPPEILVVREKSAANYEALKVHAQVRVQRRVGLQGNIGLQTSLKNGGKVRFTFPSAVLREASEEETLQLMPVSRDVAAYARGNLFDLLTNVFFEEVEIPVESQKLADAVAIAGLVAAGTDRPRAVILLATGESEDRSQMSGVQIRAYLESLAVPFYVWSPVQEPSPAFLEAWGEVESLPEPGQLGGALQKLVRQLESQAIVWLDGSHRPQDIALTEAANGFRLLR